MGFKVVIVGGSVAGLSLANMLERFNIDYILLEAYPTLAPQVGASIGLLPNGLRILDQLGCCKPAVEMAAECRYLLGDLRGPDGIPLANKAPVGASHHLERRTGYPSLFIDRQMLLQVLHGNIKHKDRLLTSQRVTWVETTEGGVEVHTQDGSKFAGDIVVGADGIHSAVRKEMWRNAREQSPGYFPDDENSRIPVSTKCIFGISKRPTTLRKGSQHMVYHKGCSYLIVSAPGDRTYWFLFVSLPETLYGKDIPKYSKEEEAALVKEHFGDRITEATTFGDIYDKRNMSTLVPLEEYVFERWHFKRIITIGDAAHKIDPISGQGGNGAIESAALLTNALVRALAKNPDDLSEEDAMGALAEVHTRRFQRAKGLVEQAHLLQSILNQRVRFSGIITKHVVPLFGPNAFVDVAVPICAGAAKIEGLPVPERSRFVPFDDELPARPIKNTLALRVPALLASGILGLSLYVAVKGSNLPASLGVPISRVLGLFAPSSVGEPVGNGPTIQSFINPVPALLTWLVESYRTGSMLSVLSWRSTYALAYTFLGANSIMPLLCLSSIWQSTRTIAGRHVPPKFAKSVLPAVVAGYILPAVGAILPIQDPTLKQLVVALWKTAPVSCALLSHSLADIVEWTHGLVRPKESKERMQLADKAEVLAHPFEQNDVDMYQKRDVIPLKVAYGSAFAIGSICYAATLWGSQGFSGVFHNMTGAFKYSNAAYTTSSIIYSLYTAWDLRALGFVKTRQAVGAGLATMATTYLLGPAAAFSGIWYWREHVVSSL